MTKAKTAAEKRDEAAQARADKAAAKKAAKDNTPSGTQIELPKGVGTQDDVPPASNPAPLERTGDRELKVREEDILRLPEDKAVWAFGTGEEASPKQLMDDQRAITQASVEK